MKFLEQRERHEKSLSLGRLSTGLLFYVCLSRRNRDLPHRNRIVGFGEGEIRLADRGGREAEGPVLAVSGQSVFGQRNGNPDLVAATSVRLTAKFRRFANWVARLLRLRVGTEDAALSGNTVKLDYIAVLGA